MSLHLDGYIHIKNGINQTNMNVCLSCVKENDQVNYQELKLFIDKNYFPILQQHLPFFENPVYTKFRFSNKSNSKDASTFHGDIYNHTNSHIMPIYTCLCYFDSAYMEVIPGSHNKLNSSSFFENINNRKRLKMSSGDMLIFHANLHHRGVKFSQPTDRRLLQIFDVFPDESTYKEHIPKLVIMRTSEASFQKSIGDISENLSKNDFILEYINLLQYFLVFYDLQYKITLLDLPSYKKKGKYISYESNARKNITDITHDDWNINIICDPHVKTISPSNYYAMILYLFILLIVIFYFLRNN